MSTEHYAEAIFGARIVNVDDIDFETVDEEIIEEFDDGAQIWAVYKRVSRWDYEVGGPTPLPAIDEAEARRALEAACPNLELGHLGWHIRYGWL